MRLLSVAHEELTRRDKRSITLWNVPGFPRHTQSLGASRRKAGAPVSPKLDIFWLKHGSLEDSAKRKSEI